MRLDRRAATWLFVLFAAVGVVVLALHVWLTRLHGEELEQRLNIELAEHLVKEAHLLPGGEIDPVALEHVFHTLMVVNPRIECYLLDTTGNILSFSAPEGAVESESVDLAPVHRFLSGERLPLRGDDPRHPERRKVFSAAPVTGENGEVDGYLYVVLAGETWDSARQALLGGFLSRLGTATLLGAFFLAFILAWLLTRGWTRRIARLTDAADAYHLGQEPHPDSSAFAGWQKGSKRADEVDRLGDSFRRLALRVDEQLAALNEADRRRRELVANVSHDLRTPLASLQGSLETLRVKWDRLSAEERGEWLEMAASQGERLSTLVRELFELATLESGDEPFVREPLLLSELVQDVEQKVRLRAEQSGVVLESELRSGVPWVLGDVRLLERVLENLLDNAIRHSPPGGSVALSVNQREGEVEVKVQDEGCGIPADELPHVFERLWSDRKDRSERRTQGRACGLGLAIASKIIDLHEGSIGVASEEGQGAAFWFRLPTT